MNSGHQEIASPMPGLPAIPAYLEKVYWWAYLHPLAVRFFERQWLVNLILWGNYRQLRDAALDALGERIDGRLLQLACVYGDFSEHLVRRLGGDSRLDIIDVAAIQLANLQRKLELDSRIHLVQQDASDLQFPDSSFDSVLLFFLLHEQPPSVRGATLAEAWRVTRPGGRIVIVDYHRPSPMHPLRYPMQAVFRLLEPYAHDLWQQEIADDLPPGHGPLRLDKKLFFGGLYQRVVITRCAA